jgi:hypothetical protein
MAVTTKIAIFCGMAQCNLADNLPTSHRNLKPPSSGYKSKLRGKKTAAI